MPADLVAALAAAPTAKAMFDILTSQNRYAVLYRIDAAKRADTRARGVEQYVAMLTRGETIYPRSAREPAQRRRNTAARRAIAQSKERLRRTTPWPIDRCACGDEERRGNGNDLCRRDRKSVV